MKKILKHLKPYKIALTVIFLLAFSMAICDLKLPGLMADIVNVGIQQNGIEHSSPSVISKEGMQFAKTFMTAEQRLRVADSYTLGFDGEIDRSRIQMERNGKTPMGEDAQIYFINNDIDDVARAELDAAFNDSAWTFIYIMQEYQKQVSEFSSEPSLNLEITNLSSEEIAQLYAMQTIFDGIPDSILGAAQNNTAQIDNALKAQTGATFAGIFYQELGMQKVQVQSKYIINIGLLMLLVALISGIFSISISYASSRISAGLAHRLREQVFEKVLKFSHSELDEFSTSTLITRATNDVNQVQTFLMMGIRMLLYAPMLALGGVFMAVLKAPSMSWIVGLVILVVSGVMLLSFALVVPKFKLFQKLTDKINLIAREHLTGIMVIRAFGTRFFEKQRFEKANSDMQGNQLYIGRAMSVLWPLMSLLISGVMLLISWVGAVQISQATIQVGDMMAFMQYAMQIIISFMFISMMFIMIPRAAVSAERIDEILESPISIQNPENPQKLQDGCRGVVEFRDVSFRYKDADSPALQNITFVARPGETTAIIGATGSGKTTLINLIMRYCDATDGVVEVGGVDVKKVDLAELRSNIGLIPQKGTLFSGTIESNLKFGREDASEEELEKAVEIAQTKSFIESKEKKFNEEISQGGTNVSGGQRQRLAIARALAKSAPIYIFDDSFSALDFKTDANLRKALKKEVKDSTLIIVAQRVSTIMNAEQILVLDEGKIAGKGTHNELLKTCPEYKEIAESQLQSSALGE